MAFAVLPEDEDVQYSADGVGIDTASFKTIRYYHELAPENWQRIVDIIDGIGGARFPLTVNTN